MEDCRARRISREASRRLVILRLAEGHDTAAAFARRLGCRPETYRPYERGERLRRLTPLLFAICETTGASLDWIFLGKGERPRGIPRAKVSIFPNRVPAA